MADMALTAVQQTFLQEAIPGFSRDTWTVSLAGQAASSRYFVRLSPPIPTADSRILVVWDSHDEDWQRFLAIPKELSGVVSCFPHIFAVDERHGLILEEDLGDMTLKRFCVDHQDDILSIEAQYRHVLAMHGLWQSMDGAVSPTISSRTLDEAAFLWETDYFGKHCVEEFCGGADLLGSAWEHDRVILARAVAVLPTTFIHRDFQSENILVCNGRIRLVDFQGARCGPPAYDIASLLYDPYIGTLSGDTISRLFDYYNSLDIAVKSDYYAFYLCAAQRLMQALGAYANLSLNKGKIRYKEFIPVAFKRLWQVVEHLPEFPAIGHVVKECMGRIKIGKK